MELNIIQKFLLLAQHPTKGIFNVSGIHLSYGIVGAALLELAQVEKISIEGDKLVVKDDRGIDNPILLEVLRKISVSKKKRKVRHWLMKLSRQAHVYKWDILKKLEETRLIRIEQKKFLGFIPYKRHYLIDRRSQSKLIEQVKKNISMKGNASDEDLVILGLIEACKMHRIIARDRSELKRIRKELKIIIKESPIAETLDSTIKQVQAAIMSAIIAAAIIPTATSN